jgi:hypothetical protein
MSRYSLVLKMSISWLESLHYNEFIHENSYPFTILHQNDHYHIFFLKTSLVEDSTHGLLPSFSALFQSSFSLPVGSTAHAKETQQYKC